MQADTTSKNRRRGRFRLLFFAFIPLLVLAGCTLPESPGTWSWDTHIYVPIGAHTYGMWQLADSVSDIHERGSGVGMNEDSSLYFAGYRQLQVSFQDSLYIPPAVFPLVKPLVAITLPVELNQNTVFSLGTLNPTIAALHGTVQDLNPHPLQSSTVISLGDQVDSMTVDSGTITLRVSNTLPYSATDLQIILDNQSGDTYLLVQGISVASGGQVSESVSLHSYELQSIAELRLVATGAGGNGILVDSTQGLTLSTQIDTLAAAPYYGIIPQQTALSDTMFDLTAQHRLLVGIIQTGTLTVTLNNQSMLDDSVWIALSNLTTQGGDTIRSRQFVPAGESRTEVLSLNNDLLRLLNTSPQRMRVQMYSKSEATMSHATFEPGNQYLAASTSTTRITFDYFQGELQNLQLNFPSVSTSMRRPPTGWDAVQPTMVTGYIHLFSGMGASATAQVDVHTLLSGVPIAQGHFDVPSVPLNNDTTLEYDSLAYLLGQYPDSMVASGAVFISGPVAIYQSQTINCDVDLRAPLEFILHPVHAPGDVERVETNDLQHVQGGSATVRVWNRLPAGGEVYLVADYDSLNVLYGSNATGVDTVARLEIPVSPIVNQRASGEAYTEAIFSLSDQTIELFQNPPFYTRLDISMPGSSGDTLISPATDYIRVQVIADVIYRLDTGGGE